VLATLVLAMFHVPSSIFHRPSFISHVPCGINVILLFLVIMLIIMILIIVYIIGLSFSVFSYFSVLAGSTTMANRSTTIAELIELCLHYGTGQPFWHPSFSTPPLLLSLFLSLLTAPCTLYYFWVAFCCGCNCIQPKSHFRHRLTLDLNLKIRFSSIAHAKFIYTSQQQISSQSIEHNINMSTY